MSNRTAQANTAIKAAWEREQALVREGKGTRDWTPEQQQDILDSGKAHDENGKAFEGHHMKNVENHPEYQSNPNNIQFLSRQEHYAAHNESFLNPTNGYYNYITGETVDFGEGQCIPCEIIDLSNPIFVPAIEIPDKTETAEEVSLLHPKDGTAKVSRVAPPEHTKKKRRFGQVLRDAFHYISTRFEAHPVLAVVFKTVACVVVVFGGAYLISKFTSGGGGYNSGIVDRASGYDTSSNDDCDETTYESDDSIDTEEDEHSAHASPIEHIVPAHGQHYHTKDGVIWKEKNSFPRGGKKSADEISSEE